jgi:putative transposase
MGFALILQRSATPTVPRVGRRPNYRAETRTSPFDDKTSHAALSEPEDTTKVQFNSGSGPQPFNQERHLVTREIYKQRRWAALAEWRIVMA